MESRLFGVSVLSDEQASLAPRFAEVDRLPGVVLPEHAVARFAARVADRHPCGDHTVFIGEVRVFPLDEQAPLVFLTDATLQSPWTASERDTAAWYVDLA